MIYRLLRRQWAHVCASIQQFFENRQADCAIAAQLRAQIPCSTDPARLERLARDAEARARLR